MSVGTEQYAVKYQGTGDANEQFPIPFSFRHTDALKVSFVTSAGVSTLKTISTHYTVIQYSDSMTTQASDGTNVISSNSHRTEYGWIVLADGVTTTDVIHVYREETFLQPTNDFDSGATTTYLNTDTFNTSVLRLTDALSTSITRDNADPSAYTAKNRKIGNLGTSIRHNDILTYSVLSNMNTTASLSIPASGGASDNGKLLAPSGLAPSTPAVSWASKLAMGLITGPGYVLSPRSDYGTSPFIEWTVARWVAAPPNNGLSWVYSYDAGNGYEGTDYSSGETTGLSAAWREFRQRPNFTIASTADVGKVVRMDSDTSCSLIAANETVEYTDNEATKRHIASNNGTIGLTPRFHYQTADQTANLGSSSFAAGSSGTINSGPIKHPTWLNSASNGFVLANTTKNDSNATTDASMVFIQPWTVAVTSSYSGATAYPVLQPHFVNDNDETETYGADLATDSNNYKGDFRMMNFQQSMHGEDIGTHSTRYLHWSGDKTWTLNMLAVFESGL